MQNATQIYAFTQQVQDAYGALMRPLCTALQMPQTALDILLFLANNPGRVTARDICTYRRLKPGIVSFHVDRLVREGYLVRTEMADRRKTQLTCTEKSAELIARGRAVQAQFLARMTDGIPQADRAACARCLAAVSANLTRILHDPSPKERKESNHGR